MSLDPWTDAAIKELQARGLSHIVWIGGCVSIAWTMFVATMSVFLSQRMTMAKLRQTGIETRLKSGEILDRIEKSRLDLSRQDESFSLLLRDFNLALAPKRKRALKEIREEICRLHSKEFCDQLRRYVEDCIIYLPKSEVRDRVLIDVLPALRISLKFAVAINHQKVLSDLNGASRYLFDKTSSIVFLQRIRKALPLLALESRWHLFQVERDFRPYYRI